jgi:hypothetical protein
VSKLKPVVSEDRPLNPTILGDFELRKAVNSPQSWGAGGAKTLALKLDGLYL